jgi:uncharacterized protein YyaL (SSP411 family)
LYWYLESEAKRLCGEAGIHLIEGLLELCQTTFDPRWYQAAWELAEAMIEHFRVPEGFYDTGEDHETLIVRPRELQDNAVPSGNAMAATVLQRLAGLAVEPRRFGLSVAGHRAGGAIVRQVISSTTRPNDLVSSIHNRIRSTVNS